jgi:hypothetical protein
MRLQGRSQTELASAVMSQSEHRLPATIGARRRQIIMTIYNNSQLLGWLRRPARRAKLACFRPGAAYFRLGGQTQLLLRWRCVGVHMPQSRRHCVALSTLDSASPTLGRFRHFELSSILPSICAQLRTSKPAGRVQTSHRLKPS